MTKKQRDEKKKLFIEALEESRGMVTTSCQRAGITKKTLCEWREKDKAFDEEINRIKEEQKEWVQGRLMTLIENGNTSATIFFLKTQCGWRETQKVEVEQIGDIDVQAAIKEIRKELADGNE